MSFLFFGLVWFSFVRDAAIWSCVIKFGTAIREIDFLNSSLEMLKQNNLAIVCLKKFLNVESRSNIPTRHTLS